MNSEQDEANSQNILNRVLSGILMGTGIDEA